MSMKKVLLALTLAFASMKAYAGGPVTSYEATNTTAGFLGIQMDLTDLVPEVVGGVRYTSTDTQNRVVGAKADIAIPLTGKIDVGPKVRLMGLAGNTSLQGEAGVGFDFATKHPLVGIGVQVPYVNGGANFEFNGKVDSYFGLNTLQDAPARTTILPLPC